MKINREDPRITAYLLGELEDKEREQFEKELEQAPESRDYLDELRLTVEMVSEELSQEPAGGLSDAHREKIDECINEVEDRDERHVVSIPQPIHKRFSKGWLALAASLLVTATVAGVVGVRMINTQPKKRLFSQEIGAVSGLVAADKLGIKESPAGVPMPIQEALHFERREKGAVLGQELARKATLYSNSYFFDYNSGEPGGPPLDEEYRAPSEPFNREAYDRITENPFMRVTLNPLSTFSIDVDTASYSNMRRYLNMGQLPPPDSVRIEELVNYFDYQYPQPSGNRPFSTYVEVAGCPWNERHRLVRIGLKGREIEQASRPASNLVFLLDVSGSMNQPNKLPLVKQSLKMLVEQLDARDRVAIVVYAGASGLVLPSTNADNGQAIIDALENLKAGGSTNGGEGIQLAYKVATDNLIKDGVNRVILATDGDFNVGITDRGQLTRLIEEKAKTGVFLTVLGFGMGNLQDATLEELSGKGNGNYGYIDTLNEAKKMMVEQIGGTLVTIAKDVKIQIEFNPARVGAYRLLGYENRMLAKEDFNDDTKDAGEIGAGHTVTALYEIIPAGQPLDMLPDVDDLKYQVTVEMNEAAASPEILTLKLRYKEPDGDTSKLIQQSVEDDGSTFFDATEDFQFAAAVASFGMLLRDSEYKGDSNFHKVAEWAINAKNHDPHGYRQEFFELVQKAQNIAGSLVRMDLKKEQE